MQIIGAVALFNEGLKAKGYSHLNINLTVTKVMLGFAIAGVLGMIIKNHINAKNENVDYLPSMHCCAW